MAQGSKFASGKFAIAISDRDGEQYPYSEMVKEVDTGLFVHQSEVDEPDPYRRLRSRCDAIALRNPRPDTSLVETIDTSDLEED